MLTEFLLLGVSVLLMLACGVFVAAEFSFVTVDRGSVERDAEAGDRSAAGLLLGLRNLSTQLSGAQLGITLTNLIIGYLSEPALASLLRPGLAAIGVLDAAAVTALSLVLALVVSTLATMLLGELIPKNFAIALPMKTAKVSQLGMRVFTKAMAWPIRFLNGAANAILRRFGIEPQEEMRSTRSPQELQSLVRRSAVTGTLADTTAELVDRSISFGDRTASDVCVPRVKVQFAPGTASAQDVIELTRATGSSRFPITGDGGQDDVIGLVQLKTAIAVPAEQRTAVTAAELAVPVTFVPDTMELDPLLAVLRGGGTQLAIVLDEYGGTYGLVTWEDRIEAIVGEISAEHDRLGSSIQTRPEGGWFVSGLLRPDEVGEHTGVRLPEDGPFETMAGLFLQQSGKLPVVGDEVHLTASTPDPDPSGSGRVQVLAVLRAERVEGRRLDRIALWIPDPDAPAGDPEQPASGGGR